MKRVEKNLKEKMRTLITYWQAYLHDNHWQSLLKNIVPKKTGCGLIYELESALHRAHESFAIADMRSINYSEPHYHRETEIYFVLQGQGIIVVGGKEELVTKDSVIIIPSNRAHFTIPQKDLILAVINTPPFNPEHYIILTTDNHGVGFSKAQFDTLAQQNSNNSKRCSRG